MDLSWHVSTLLLTLHAAVIVTIGLRVVMARPLPGVALAWLFLVALLPGIGLLCYLGIGERRLGGRRARRLAELRLPYVERLREILQRNSTQVDWSLLPDTCESMNTLGRAMTGIPTFTGNELQLLGDAVQVLRAILRDVEQARATLHLQFYIWKHGGIVGEIEAALVRAAQRGVACGILVDAVGSGAWLRSEHPARLRAAGVEIVTAMPTGAVRALFQRYDLRNHRKIVVVDGEVAYTGSSNMVDPRGADRPADVGRTVDAMVRMRGPAVEAISGVLLSDWFLETLGAVEALPGSRVPRERQPEGPANVQVLPSGPAGTGDAILQMLLTMLYAARRRVSITTPYFIPDEAMLRALRSAATRGVEVTLMVPAEADSLLVNHASRSYYQDLMDVGVRLQQYHGGFLHTKSIVVDEQITMFGTVNLDMRSLWLNYEVSLFVYDAGFGARLHALHESYLRECVPIDPMTWRKRTVPRRLVENLARLFSPLL